MKNTSKAFIILTSLVLIFAVSCASTAKESQIIDEPIVEAILEVPEVIETPVVEAIQEPITVVKEEPKVEPVAEAVVEAILEKPAKVDFQYKYSFAFLDYSIDCELHNGFGYISYPAVFTDQQIYDALALFVKAHGSYGATYTKTAPGKLYVTYADNVSRETFDALAALAQADLSWYLTQLFPPKVEFTYNYNFAFYGNEVDVELHNGYGYITYPTFVTDAQLQDVFGAFVKAHGSFGITYNKVAAGKLEITYQENVEKETFDSLATLAQNDLVWYLNTYYPPKVEFTYVYSFAYGEYSIGIEAHNGYGYITYPSFLTNQDVAKAFAAFVQAHGSFGIEYQFANPGKLEVTYAEGYEKPDFDYLAQIAANDLVWYINQLLAPKTEEVKETPTTTTSSATVEPAVEESAVEPVVEPVATPVVAPVIEIKSEVIEEKKAEPVVEVKTTVVEEKKVEPVVEVKTTVVEEVAPAVEETKKSVPAILVILIILFILAGLVYCFFGLYKGMSIDDIIEETKKFFTNLWKKISKN